MEFPRKDLQAEYLTQIITGDKTVEGRLETTDFWNQSLDKKVIIFTDGNREVKVRIINIAWIQGMTHVEAIEKAIRRNPSVDLMPGKTPEQTVEDYLKIYPNPKSEGPIHRFGLFFLKKVD